MYIYTDDLLLCQLKYCLCYNNKDSMHHLSKRQHSPRVVLKVRISCTVNMCKHV